MFDKLRAAYNLDNPFIQGLIETGPLFGDTLDNKELSEALGLPSYVPEIPPIEEVGNHIAVFQNLCFFSIEGGVLKVLKWRERTVGGDEELFDTIHIRRSIKLSDVINYFRGSEEGPELHDIFWSGIMAGLFDNYSFPISKNSHANESNFVVSLEAHQLLSISRIAHIGLEVDMGEGALIQHVAVFIPECIPFWLEDSHMLECKYTPFEELGTDLWPGMEEVIRNIQDSPSPSMWAVELLNR